ncbi:MAG: hypothetical protein EOO75_00420, partial [Myxococcales bacterium]
MSEVKDEIGALPDQVRQQLQRGSFDAQRLVRWADEQRGGIDREATNRLDSVSVPEPGDVVPAPAPGSDEYQRHLALGEEALRRGEVALLGGHIARGDVLTVEVVSKAGDKGGIPVRY